MWSAAKLAGSFSGTELSQTALPIHIVWGASITLDLHPPSAAFCLNFGTPSTYRTTAHLEANAVPCKLEIQHGVWHL